jgi:hypothetical protein
MDFEEATKKLKGESVGGQLIAPDATGKPTIVGHHHDGQLIVAGTLEAQALIAGITPKPKADKTGRKERGAPEPEPDVVEEEPDGPANLQLDLSDEIKTDEKLG